MNKEQMASLKLARGKVEHLLWENDNYLASHPLEVRAHLITVKGLIEDALKMER